MNYTETWSNGRGAVKYVERSDGSRLRYFTAGTGPPLVLMHTELDYFQKVIPLLWDSFTIYALELPGMGWSDIVPGARYEEPELRAAIVEFVTTLDLGDVTLAGESLGAALALVASIDLKDRVGVYSDQDWPRPHEREYVAQQLSDVERITLSDTGHFPRWNARPRWPGSC
jgi:Alpha/beta hydrolase family